MKPALLLAAGALLAAAAGLTRPPGAAQDPGLKAVDAGGGVTMLIGSGGNIGVLPGPQGVLVVDAQFAEGAPAVLAEILRLREDATVEWLINTHHHRDHVGGSAVIGAGALRMAHAKVRERMGGPPEALPELTWEDGVTLHLNGQRVETKHYAAGHTDGDSIVIFHDSGVVHLGDLFFNQKFPFVDHDGGGTVAGMLAALKSVRADIPPHWKIIPGHGPLATPEDLDATIRMIEATLGLVRERVAAGRTSAQILAEGLPAEWDSWSWQFIPTARWLATLARECGAQ